MGWSPRVMLKSLHNIPSTCTSPVRMMLADVADVLFSGEPVKELLNLNTMETACK